MARVRSVRTHKCGEYRTMLRAAILSDRHRVLGRTMFVVNSLPIAIIFCVITMLGWGSWANTQKLAGKERWPFQLFYWDYAIGVFLFSILFAALLGGPYRENLHAAEFGYVLPALLSGAIFNLSNILLVVGIDAAGMAVAFPVGVGLALVIGTVESYIATP